MFERIRDVLLEYVDVEKEDITPDTRFLADLKMNSLDIMTMIGQLEDEMDIIIETEDLNSIFTIRQLVDYIEERV